ncbi:response regulator transcription factor [Microbacteriaceae bacterium VKM Ac-2855]|nr:response regulator transcription factor [Microbacteriaceae bacterium VKM Ac-2855]
MSTDENRRQPIRVAVIDDDELVRCALRIMLSTEEQIEVVAESSGGAGVPDLLRRTAPDVVLVDLRLGLESGIDLARRIRALFPATHLIGMSSFALEAIRKRASLAGFDQFVAKTGPPGRFAQAILRAGDDVSRPAEPATWRSTLTTREREVVALIAAGAGNDRIAAALHLSESTVRTYVSRIFDKAGVRTRVELAILARGES